MLNKDNGNLLQTLTSLVGVDFSGLPFVKMFSNPALVGVIFSSRAMASLPVQPIGQPLDELTTVKKGLSIVTKFRLTNCDGDIFCQFFKTILGDQEMTFTASEIRGRSVTISAKIPGTISFAGFSLKNVEAGLRLQGTPSFGLTNVELDVPTPDSQTLHFVGSLTVDPAQNAEASLQMNGIYDKPLGFPFAAIGNLRASIRTNIACPLCISALSLGGELRLGSNCVGAQKSNCIIGQGNFGVDALTPENNFFYFSLNQFSFSKLLTSLGIPRFSGMEIVDISTLSDVKLSYSANGATLPAGRVPTAVQVPAGLVLKGKMTILWFAGVDAEVIVSTTLGAVTSVRGSLIVDPVNIGPLLSMTSATNSRKGPSFTINVGVNPPSLRILMEGQFRIPALQVSAKAVAQIYSTQFHVSLSAPIFGIPAKFAVYAQFQNRADPRSFKEAMMWGSFGGDIGSKITNGVNSALNSVRDHINNKFNFAKNVLRRIQDKFDHLFNNKEAKKAIRDAKQATYDAAKAAFDAAQAAVDAVCKIHDCKRCGIPKPCTKQSCRCGVKYPCGWRSWCCRTVCVPYPSTCGTFCLDDPACLAKNKACYPIRKAADVTLSNARRALEIARKALEAAIRAYEAALKALNDYNPLLLLAKQAVNKLQELLNRILDILNPFPFAINSIGFNLKVASASKTAMSVTLEMTIFTRPQRLSVTLNLGNPASIAGSLARRFFNNAFDLLNQFPTIPTP